MERASFLALEEQVEEDSMLVKDAMTADAARVDAGRTVRQAAQRLRQLDIGCMPVTEDDRVVGLFTDRDIACRIVAEGRDPESVTVGAMMSEKALCCRADQQLEAKSGAKSGVSVEFQPVRSASEP